MKMRSSIATLGLSFALALAVAAPATAQPESGGNVAKAKELFDAGAREYENGRFDLAIQAFEQAYKIAPRDGIMFSTAQAHRRQYTRTSDAAHLLRAVELYKLYIDRVKAGGRVTDAVKALGELEPQLKSLDPATAPQPSQTAGALKTRIVVNIFVPGTTVSIDNKPAKAPPINEEVEPGKHVVKLSAPGYFDEVREIAVEKGEIAPANLPQRERPAAFTINTESGAEISIDGRFVGEAPLTSAIELPSGRHFVAILKTGHETYTKEVELKRGARETLDADLQSTTQRDLSYVVIGGAAAFATAGIIFGGLALERESAAQDILDARDARTLSRSEVADYEDIRRERSLYTALAAAGGGAGVALGLLGVGLAVFDEPRAVAAPRMEGPTREREPGSDEPKDIEVSGAPVISPDFLGGTMRLRF